MDFNLAVILRESAARTPDRPVALYDGGTMSYAELDRLSGQVAAGLVRVGIGPGDAVGLQLPNIPQFLVAYFGILKAGGVVVPMNVLLKAPEVAHYLGDSDAKALITYAGVLDDAAKGAAEAGVADVFVVGPAPEANAAAPFEQLLADVDPSQAPFAPRRPTDTAVIIYTSGTTGRPKGAELTHFGLYMNCDIPGRLFSMRDDDIVLTVLPLFHVFGLSSVLNIAVRFGGTMSLVPRFDPATVLERIQRDRATVFEGVPTMFVGLLHAPDLDRYDVSSLRIAVSGGAAIPAEVIDAFEQRFGVVILEGYGLSETASTATFNVSAEERKVYSVGKAIWGTEVQVWDRDGRRLPPGRDNVGEFVVRGYNVTKGYYNRPEATAEAFAGGWFHTGDLGYQDEDGFFFIVDRKKDLIIRGGYNVYPREVEEVLYSHSAVAEAAVIGIPDERLGEEVKAFLALKRGTELTEDEVISFTRERLAAYKYPRSVEFRDELPKGPTGKLLKTELR
ncbi:long-chain fatty acid--CoA ligase [Geodermatophilus sp. TF02-6]|uniref:long-chain-fatty-acid--CoA ligase n=1 Tax=Geodermatophilus sp. TF02-6 TaxID=2250575 RepID=UPI000DE9EBA1|nr:long-chain fatty acid--CoA ligase [Geodermatophilus sp. TF02-6]RBY76406.1 long-chain fatty acid--CoA ligase [Geodermatophilus sp. TF02-6]